ncbi:hypothetical protein AB0383_20140 [Amycolatopsis sp. NPDC051373]|uniref:hypothetical protein n=1 Tax=Amycolatopsis sp. NPDC051373 TaxID=3155801 RepID=UPI00344FC016
MTQPPPLDRFWYELDGELRERGLQLIDISRVSRYPERRTNRSLSYLSNLRSGTRGYPQPNPRVVKEIADAIGCTVSDLKRKQPAEQPAA